VGSPLRGIQHLLLALEGGKRRSPSQEGEYKMVKLKLEKEDLFFRLSI
jgi:hypothetical protein